MAFRVVPSTVVIVMHYPNLASGRSLNRIHAKYLNGPPSAGDCANLATQIRTLASSHFSGLLLSGFQITPFTVEDLGSATGATGQDNTPVSGSLVGNILPAQIAVLIEGKIARKYRGGKPRVYLPFFDQGALENESFWLPATITAMTTAWQAFISGLNGMIAGNTTLQGWHNVSLFDSKAPRPVPLVEPITSFSVAQRPGTQRRRNRP